MRTDCHKGLVTTITMLDNLDFNCPEFMKLELKYEYVEPGSIKVLTSVKYKRNILATTSVASPSSLVRTT